MKDFIKTCVRTGIAAPLSYLWSGWGALGSLLLFMALWQWGHGFYGSFILPSPLEAIASLAVMWNDGSLPGALAVTLRRALAGFVLAMFAGTLLGILAGLSVTVTLAVRPLVTLLLGVPPIAWIVLALIWFGIGDGTPIFTVFVAAFPLVFANALAGMRTLDPKLEAMCRTFGLSAWRRLIDLRLPHLAAYLLPAAIIALGSAWKVAVMAELLTAAGGVGDRLASARQYLDTAATLALMLAMTGLLLGVEYLFLEPLRRRLEGWRQ